MSNPLFLFNNNASTLLASAITSAGQTTISVTATTGSQFPTPSYPTSQAAITVEDVGGVIEVMYLTTRSGDSFTVLRGQEGTTAQASFASGSRVEQRVTAGVLSSLMQKSAGDTVAAGGTTTNLSGVLALGAGGSIQGGEFTGYIRSGAGVTAGQLQIVGNNAMCNGSTVLTVANFLSNLPAGYDFCHTNMIVMWYGTTGNVPAGWQLCDGTAGTPDLNNQFIVGSTVSNTTGNTSSGATGSTTPTGSNGTYTLTLGDIPAHKHPIYYSGANANLISGTGASGGISGSNYMFTGGGSTLQTGSTDNQTGAGSNAHTHTFAGVAHTHTITGPPYAGLLFIMKT